MPAPHVLTHPTPKDALPLYQPVPLRPGDVLLYSGQGVFSSLIRVKTWSRVSHCEGFYHQSLTVASRDGQGVGVYPYTHRNLVAVLRPVVRPDIQAAMDWFDTVHGQPYDWFGLLSFTLARFQGKDNGKMFCSEFLTRWLRRAGVECFPNRDADAVPPDAFLWTPRLELLWTTLPSQRQY